MKKYMIMLIVTTLASSVFAGDIARKGTAGAAQLLIPIGAKSIATSGAFLSSVSGVESIYYNPAGLDLADDVEFMFSYMDYLADIKVSFFGVSSKVGQIGSFGFSIKTMDFGDIPVTTINFPDGTGQTFSPSYLTAGLTYSKIITDRISVGANFKLIYESIINTSATGFGFDAGVQYKFDENLSMGLAIKNIGPNMRYTGSDLQQRVDIPDASLSGYRQGMFEVVTEDFQLPSFFEMSAAYEYQINKENKIQVGGTYVANNVLEDRLNLGLEYGYNDLFFVRGGYAQLMENQGESIYGFAAGAGLKYKPAGGLGFSFDYAFRVVKEFPSNNHVLTVKMFIY